MPTPTEALRAEGQELLAADHLADCIARFEEKLRALPDGPIRAILGRDLLGQVDAAADYLERLHERASRHVAVTQIDLASEGFAGPPQPGFADGEGGDHVPKADGLDWLDDLDEFDPFEPAGYGPIREAHADLGLRDPARPLAELLATLRLMELFRAAHLRSVARGPALADVVVVTSAFDQEFFHVSDPPAGAGG